jgi:hypothetical protein
MIDLNEIEKLAKDLMQQHGLDGWLFRWSNAKTYYGYCLGTDKIIELSKPLTLLNSFEDTLDTILHEIAHALAGCENGHNWHWKMACAKVGAKPERCYDSTQIKQPVKKYVGKCLNGHKTTAHRKTKRACYRCCHEYNSGYHSNQFLLKWSINLEWMKEQIED